MYEFELRVDGMTCADCERAATRELIRIDGVEDVRADVPAGLIWVVCRSVPPRDQVEAAVYDAGFDLTATSDLVR
jgi:copper chaperone CopZ